jgi:hypothetical protein
MCKSGTDMKAQVSFFIIIGVLAVIAVVSALLIFNVTPPKVNERNEPNFVLLQSCVDNEFIDVITLVGLQGGYIEITPSLQNAGAYFEPMPNYQFPLWNKDGISYIPTVSEIEKQVQDSLSKRLVDRCLKEEGILMRDAPVVKVIIGQTKNTAQISFPGEFLSESSTSQIPPMQVENTLPLKSSLDIASSIAMELLDPDTALLMSVSHNILQLTPDIPTTGSDFSCNAKQWSKSNVQNSFQKGLEIYAPYLRFNGFSSIDSDIARKHFTFNIPLANSPNINIRANYNSAYGILFDVEKSQGDIMTSMVTVSPETPGICQNHYSFWYSMRFPMIFVIENNAVSPSYNFRMALYNEVFRNQLDDEPEFTNDYCSDTTYKKATINLQDSSAHTIINAFARIKCGSEECVLRTNSEGIINDYIPRRCISGTVTIEKQGYETATTFYNAANFNHFEQQTITMSKLRKITLSFNGDDMMNEFIYMIQSNGRTFTFSNYDIFIPATDTDVTFILLRMDEVGNLVPEIQEPISESNDIEIIIYSERLQNGDYTANDLVSINEI